MANRSRRSKARSRSLKVGDRVWLRRGSRRIIAEVVEDRGRIGVGGRQLLRIREAGQGDDPARVYEIPAEEIVLASA